MATIDRLHDGNVECKSDSVERTPSTSVLTFASCLKHARVRCYLDDQGMADFHEKQTSITPRRACRDRRRLALLASINISRVPKAGRSRSGHILEPSFGASGGLQTTEQSWNAASNLLSSLLPMLAAAFEE